MALTKEKAYQVIQSLYQHLSIVKAFKMNSVSAQSFYDILHKHPELQEFYALTKKTVTEMYISQIVELADSNEDPQKVRNQIHARQWLASKLNPKVYGDKLGIEVEAGPNLREALARAKERVIRSIEGQSEGERGEVITIPSKTTNHTARAVQYSEDEPKEFFSSVKSHTLENGQVVLTTGDLPDSSTGSEPVDNKKS